MSFSVTGPDAVRVFLEFLEHERGRAMSTQVATRGEAIAAFLEWAGSELEAGRHRCADEDVDGYSSSDIAEGYAILQAESDSLTSPDASVRFVVLAREPGKARYHTFETARSQEEAERLRKDFAAAGNRVAVYDVLSLVMFYIDLHEKCKGA